MSSQYNQLETEFGTAILEELTGERLTRKGQKVRLFDQSGRTAEYYYPENNKGVPCIYDHALPHSWYPITAYCAFHGVDKKTAVKELSKRFLGGATLLGKRYAAQRTRQDVAKVPPLPASYHEPEYVVDTLGDYERNNFVTYLRRLLGTAKADELLIRFGVGTGKHWHLSQHWPRTTIFWQVDEQGRVHGGKVIFYSAALGRRIKEKKNEYPPTWVHSLESLPAFNYKPCLFGLHQLTTEPANKPIALVESEKTAIICTAFEPGFIWLATGGSGNLNAEVCQVLKGRTITLFPDLKCFSKWKEKAEQISKVVGCHITVSPILEGLAKPLDRDAGYDLADFLTRYRDPVTGRVLSAPEGSPVIFEPSIPIKTIVSDKPKAWKPFAKAPLIWNINAAEVCAFIRWAVIPYEYEEQDWPLVSPESISI